MDRGERIRIQSYFPSVTGLLTFPKSVYPGIPARSMAVLLASVKNAEKMPRQKLPSWFDEFGIRAF